MTQASSSRKLMLLLTLISGVTLFLHLPIPISVPLGFIQFFYLPGLVFLMLLGNERRPVLDNYFVPLVVSPVVLSLLILAAHAITGALDSATRLALGVVHLLFAVALARKKAFGVKSATQLPAAVVAISVIFAAIVASAYLMNDYMLVRSDAWHHTSIVKEILDRGIPPMEPRFPDLPLRYMWFYHLLQACWKLLSGLPLLSAMGFANVVSALAFPYLFARITSLFTDDRRLIIYTPLFAIAGLGAASWILWPVIFGRALVGDVRGWAAISQTFREMELNRATVQDALTPYHTYLANVVHKFLTITAINYSVNLLLLSFVMILDVSFHVRSRLRAAAGILVVILGTFLFHIITGIVLILTSIASAVLMKVSSRLLKWESPPAFTTYTVPGLACAAGLMGFPYFLSLTRGGPGGGGIAGYLHLGWPNLLTIMAPLVVLYPFSKQALTDLFANRSAPQRSLASWILSLLAMSIFVNLPGMAERKLAAYLFLFMTPPIAWKLIQSVGNATGRRRRLLVSWIVLLFAVQPIMTVRGFILDKPIETFRVKRYRISSAENEIFEWIQSNTAINAVIIEGNTYNLMPVRASRRSFFPDPGVIIMNGFGGEKVDRYREIRRNLFADEPFDTTSLDYLRAVGQDFYLVVWTEDLGATPHLPGKLLAHPEWFTLVYENTAGWVFLINL